MRPAKSKSFVPEAAGRAAFTLVEIALALGIFAFAIVALLGLVVVGTDSTRESATDTALGMMTQTTLVYLRSQVYATTRTRVASGSYNQTNTTPSFYYDNAGRMALDANGNPATTVQSDSVYYCVVSGRAPAGASVSTSNLLYLQLQFRSPATVPVSAQPIRIVDASIANYD